MQTTPRLWQRRRSANPSQRELLDGTERMGRGVYPVEEPEPVGVRRRSSAFRAVQFELAGVRTRASQGRLLGVSDGGEEDQTALGRALAGQPRGSGEQSVLVRSSRAG